VCAKNNWRLVEVRQLHVMPISLWYFETDFQGRRMYECCKDFFFPLNFCWIFVEKVEHSWAKICIRLGNYNGAPKAFKELLHFSLYNNKSISTMEVLNHPMLMSEVNNMRNFGLRQSQDLLLKYLIYDVCLRTYFLQFIKIKIKIDILYVPCYNVITLT
jgi:hypothetical protein